MKPSAWTTASVACADCLQQIATRYSIRLLDQRKLTKHLGAMAACQYGATLGAERPRLIEPTQSPGTQRSESRRIHASPRLVAAYKEESLARYPGQRRQCGCSFGLPFNSRTVGKLPQSLPATTYRLLPILQPGHHAYHLQE